MVSASAINSTDNRSLFAKIIGGIRVEAQTPSVCQITGPIATAAAKKISYIKINTTSNGQSVYFSSKVKNDMKYITPDVGSNNGNGSHNGGFWKAASSVENLGSKTTRTGTFNQDLTIRIGD